MAIDCHLLWISCFILYCIFYVFGTLTLRWFLTSCSVRLWWDSDSCIVLHFLRFLFFCLCMHPLHSCRCACKEFITCLMALAKNSFMWSLVCHSPHGHLTHLKNCIQGWLAQIVSHISHLVSLIWVSVHQAQLSILDIKFGFKGPPCSDCCGQAFIQQH